MYKMQIRLHSWISETLGVPTAGDYFLYKQVKEGSSIADLLTDLAGDYPEFGKQVFNPETGEMSNQVMVILNDTLLSTGEIACIKLNDMDIVTLSPVIFGG